MFKINYKKTDPIQIDILEKQHLEEVKEDSSSLSPTYFPFAIQNIQLYNPIYKTFFEMTSQNVERVALNHPYHIKDLHTVFHIDTKETIERDIFIKFSPLLDPYHYMMGKYDVNDPNIRILPNLDNITHPKLLLQNNASYVDCFFNYLSSSLLHKHGFVNGIDFYGSFLGIQKQFRVNITDDLGYLRGSDFFNDNIGKLFSVDNDETQFFQMDEYNGSRCNKKRLQIENDQDNEPNIITDIINLEDIQSTTEIINNYEVVYSNKNSNRNTTTSTNSTVSSVSSISSVSSVLSDNDSTEWTTDSESSEESSENSEEEDVHAYINDFPIQMICLEKCKGTLDQLFIDQLIDPTIGASILFQITMSLLVYQKAFKFTHNDLHTNNVMYIETDIEYLYYKYAGNIYRVPTYGRIFKIIDFGRGIYKFQNSLFCSDSFASNGDAARQYNFEPFMNKNKPRLDPNYSFDLCRLGSSIYDFIIDSDMEVDSMDELQKTIHRWCMDDNGKNILYKKNGEERYPSFKLYKMIARTVSHHTPDAQLEYEFFSQYKVSKEEDLGTSVIFDIDTLPIYV